jgi:carbonic anhydrase
MKMLKNALLLAVAGCLVATATPASDHPAKSDSLNRFFREGALALLKEGNARFVTGKLQHPNLDPGRRTNTVAEGQEPFATILTCSDSRCPVEHVFDRGIGDLFVVRVAGNVAGPSELATLEYGVGHLNTPLLVVLGHTKCGAVTATAKGVVLHGHLPLLAERIRPAVAKAKAEPGSPDELVSRAITANVWQAIADILQQSTEIREKAAVGQVQVVGAIYDLEGGAVTWLGAHPSQAALLAKPRPSQIGQAEPASIPRHSAVQSPRLMPGLPGLFPALVPEAGAAAVSTKAAPAAAQPAHH